MYRLLEGVDLQALLGDKAFDADGLKKRLLVQGCQVVIAQKTQSTSALANRYGGLQVAAPDREFLLQAQGIQAHCTSQRQDRQQFRCCHYVGARCDLFTLNLSTP